MTFPSGTVTFLFTDIEGSTKIAREYPEQCEALFERHNAILHSAIENRKGVVFRIVGDSISAAFHTADDALNAALQAQRDLHIEPWSPAPVKVRMGIHTGAAQAKNDPSGISYEGYATLALTQRVMSAGHGGQILLSQTTHDLVKEALRDEIELRDIGEHKLKDILHLERLYQVTAPNLPSEFPALKTLETVRHNLSAQLTSFIGREHEVKEASEKLASAKLLTLIGPGGTGKTRLSIQIGADQLANFKNGVWLVELAPVSDSAFIIPAIASVFEIREVQNIPLAQLVIDYLRAK
jgi:class 3 adenylate cyclase